MNKDIQSPSEYEERHVHEVYEHIAAHFSSTRYKPWPIVEQFLSNVPDGSIGVDIGCGNGKYLAVNRNIFITGSDRSTNLTEIARRHVSHEAVVADALAVPHRPGSMDFAISIAVIHHLSSPERRIDAVKAVLEVLKPRAGDDNSKGSTGGKALIYVWALEQKGSRRGWDEGDDQDVMVPWVMKAGQRQNTNEVASQGLSSDQTFYRYYHLYSKGELESDIEAAGGRTIESGYEKDNWWAIAQRRV